MISQKEAGGPDGMKCDERGNVWCTGPGGVWVFSPKAELLGRIAVPEVVGNLHWGGADFKTLFLAASTSVYSLRTKVGPRAEPFMGKQRPAAARARAGRSKRARPRQRLGPRTRSGPLRPHHPGSAERCDQRGRGLRQLRGPRAMPPGRTSSGM
jgi:Gluconolactonase